MMDVGLASKINRCSMGRRLTSWSTKCADGAHGESWHVIRLDDESNSKRYPTRIGRREDVFAGGVNQNNLLVPSPSEEPTLPSVEVLIPAFRVCLETASNVHAGTDFGCSDDYKDPKGAPVIYSSARTPRKGVQGLEKTTDGSEADFGSPRDGNDRIVGRKSAGKGTSFHTETIVASKSPEIRTNVPMDVNYGCVVDQFPQPNFGFKTGGMYVQVSSDARKRARSLLDADVDSESTFNIYRPFKLGISNANCFVDSSVSGTAAIHSHKASAAITVSTLPASNDELDCIIEETNVPGFNHGHLAQVSCSSMRMEEFLLGDKPDAKLSRVMPADCGFDEGKFGIALHRRETVPSTSLSNTLSGLTVGFQTGGGRHVPLSAAALKRARLLFEEEESELESGPPSRKTAAPSTSASPDYLKMRDKHMKPELLETPFSPDKLFKTGKGEPFKVSSKAMGRAKILLEGRNTAIAKEEEAQHVDNKEIFATSFVKGQAFRQYSVSVEDTTGVKENSLMQTCELRKVNFSKGNDPSMSTMSPVQAGQLISKMQLRQSPLQERTNLPLRWTGECKSAKKVTGVSDSETYNKWTKLRTARAFKPPRFLGPWPITGSCAPCKSPEAGTNCQLNCCLSLDGGSHTKSNPLKNGSGLPTVCPKFLLEPKLRTLLQTGFSSKPIRRTLREYFGQHTSAGPGSTMPAWHARKEVHCMTVESAGTFELCSSMGQKRFDSGDMWRELLDAGAVPNIASQEWVENHYKLIVWKLACLERRFPLKADENPLLTVQNVCTELKYRYDRELSGHRSAIKRITERDAPAGQMMVVCVSAVYSPTVDMANEELLVHQLNWRNDNMDGPRKMSGIGTADIEITDGWYRMNAFLDTPLRKKLQDGKLRVGQKIRICGANLVGCPDGLPPLEAFKGSSLLLQFNGTYRASWDEHMGFCKGPAAPLALHCIEPGGGHIPKTLIGVTRVYPVLYRERIADGHWITRSARAEEFATQQFDQRRAKVMEEVILKMEEGDHLTKTFRHGLDEGARLYVALETAAEPELLMADMSPAQHRAFSTYKAQRDNFRQLDIERTTRKALDDAKLLSRDVTAILRVRVTGLKCVWNTSNHSGQVLNGGKKAHNLEGLITLWQPSDDQRIEEGGVYCVSGLLPSGKKSGNTDLLYLNSSRSTRWQKINAAAHEQDFVLSFSPRVPTRLSDLSEHIAGREFDTVGLVLHVGEPYVQGYHMRQWLFVADGSCSQSTPMLAINVASLTESFLPISPSLVGCVVAHCNLLGGFYDSSNDIWTAEALEHHDFSTIFTGRTYAHLQSAAAGVRAWADTAGKVVEELRARVSIITNCAKLS